MDSGLFQVLHMKMTVPSMKQSGGHEKMTFHYWGPVVDFNTWS